MTEKPDKIEKCKTLKIVRISALTEKHWEAYRECLAPNAPESGVEFIRRICHDENGERNKVSLKDAMDFRKAMEAEHNRLRNTEFLRTTRGKGLPR